MDQNHLLFNIYSALANSAKPFVELLLHVFTWGFICDCLCQVFIKIVKIPVFVALNLPPNIYYMCTLHSIFLPVTEFNLLVITKRLRLIHLVMIHIFTHFSVIAPINSTLFLLSSLIFTPFISLKIFNKIPIKFIFCVILRDLVKLYFNTSKEWGGEIFALKVHKIVDRQIKICKRHSQQNKWIKYPAIKSTQVMSPDIFLL